MPRLTSTTTPTDARRCTRLLIAWLDGDKLALDTVLDEVMADDLGAPGLLFALTDFAAGIGEQAAPDIRDQLRASLLNDEEETD